MVRPSEKTPRLQTYPVKGGSFFWSKMRVGKAEISEHGLGKGSRAFFLLILLKRDNPRGFIYFENIPAQPSKYNLSRSTFYRYIDWLIARKLIVRDGKQNLSLKTIDRAGDRKSFYRNKIEINETDNIDTVKSKLQANVLNRHLRGCKYMADLKEESAKMERPNGRLKMFPTVRALRKAQRKFLPGYDTNPEETLKRLTFEKKLKLSDKKAGKLLGISSRTYNRIKKKLRQMGLTFWRSLLVQLPYSVEFHRFDPLAVFAHKGRAYYSYTEYFYNPIEPEPTVYEKIQSKYDIVLENYIKMWEEEALANLGKSFLTFPLQDLLKRSSSFASTSQ